MTERLTPEEMKEIASRFAGLMRLLTHDGEAERPAELRDLLIDRLRDALDRRLPSMGDGEAGFIGNSFLVEAVIHSNTRTVVTRMRHRDLGSWHAMKTLSAHYLNDVMARTILLREARVGMALRHPNLMAVECSFRLPDGCPAVIMEWAGASLSQRLSMRSVSVVDIRHVMTSLLRGLHAMHAAGYVHGDISAANLLICDDDFERLKIADFGSAIEAGKRYRDLDLAKAATPGFAAPELASDKAADPRSDLYSAGCVMKLLLEHCHQAHDPNPLMDISTRLADPDVSRRPPNAMAALELFETK